MREQYSLRYPLVNSQSALNGHGKSYRLSLMSLSARVKSRMDDLGLTQVRLADMTGISQNSVHKILAGKTRETRKLHLLAQALMCSTEWLATGRGPMTERDIQGGARNVEPGPDIRGKVPLISWVRAGDFCGISDPFQPGDAENWLPSIQDLGPYAYALRVKGDSMTAPYGRSYPEGVIVYVDPDAPVTNGCRVIVKIPDAEEATFKVYVEDAGRKYLKPLNPQYPTIEMTPDMVICGVVRGAYMPE